MYVVEHVVHVIAQEIHKHRCGSCANDVNFSALQDRIDRCMERLSVKGFLRLAELLSICGQHQGNHILIANTIIGNTNALHRSKTVKHQFLKRLLHAGVSIIAQLHRKAHHSRFRYTNCLSKLIGGHERSLIVGFSNVRSDPTLALRECGRKRLQLR